MHDILGVIVIAQDEKERAHQLGAHPVEGANEVFLGVHKGSVGLRLPHFLGADRQFAHTFILLDETT